MISRSRSDTTSEITSLDQIQGDWWILKGQNCGQDEIWNGGYDAYPCQLESFVETDAGWVRNTTYCFGEDNACTSQTINIAPEAILESPPAPVHPGVGLPPQRQCIQLNSWQKQITPPPLRSDPVSPLVGSPCIANNGR